MLLGGYNPPKTAPNIKNEKVSETANQVVDSIERELLIKPEGVPRHSYYQQILTVNGVSTLNLQDTRLASVRSVPESGFAEIRVTGDIMGPTIDNLDRLVSMPYGCGEQNMITVVPNILVARYYKAVGALSPELEKKIVRHLAAGYGRELTYRHTDGSFSAFGESDPEGSLWLTAFVVSVFSDIAESGLISVDQAVLRQAGDWIMSKQNTDGSFPRVGQVIHKEMMGGENNAISLTAYTLRALGRYVEVYPDEASRLQDPISRGNTWLGAQTPVSTYDIVQTYLTLLTGTPSLEYDEKGCVRGDHDTELSGMMLLAVLEDDNADKSLAPQLQRCLVSKMTAMGGYGSTQDTVVALSAITAYALDVVDDMNANNAEIEIHESGNVQRFSINSTNARLVQRTVVQFNSTVQVNVSGEGKILVALASFYNVLPKEAIPTKPCEIITGVIRADSTDYLLTVNFTCPFDDVMGIVMINSWTGTKPKVTDGIIQGRRLQEASTDIKRVEIDKTNSEKISFYYDSMGKITRSVQVEIEREFSVNETKPGTIEICEYYENECTVIALDLRFDGEESHLSPWEITGIVLGGIAVVALSIFGHKMKIRQPRLRLPQE